MLSRKERIKYSGLFQQAFEKGKTIYSKNLKLTATKSRESHLDQLPLVGFVISKTFSKSAVKRNRIKRQLREVYRLFRQKAEYAEKLKSIGLLIIGLKKNSALGSYSQIKNELEALLIKAV